MNSINIYAMREFLSKSISSMNKNKLHGLLAEIDFRRYITGLGFSHRVSVGGWVSRSTGDGNFGHHTIVAFPEIIQPEYPYTLNPDDISPPLGLHTICATFRQLGVRSYYCMPRIPVENGTDAMTWQAKELGIPWDEPYQDFPGKLTGFLQRPKPYNFLRYNTDISNIPDQHIAEEFSKEHLRVTLANAYLAETSDVDGILWGKEYTYPLEIKEKTSAADPKYGEYFGLDVGPLVKLAHYAAKKNNLHSLFIVREINDTISRELADWHYITFENLARVASWVPRSGGKNMQGGASTVVIIPKCEFSLLNKAALDNL